MYFQSKNYLTVITNDSQETRADAAVSFQFSSIHICMLMHNGCSSCAVDFASSFLCAVSFSHAIQKKEKK